MSENKNDIDRMMEENQEDFKNDGFLIVDNVEELYSKDGLIVKSQDEDAEDIFDEDEESIEKRRNKARREILLERKKISQKYPNSNQYLNKKGK